MRRWSTLLVLGSLLAAAGCQSSSAVQTGSRECSPRAEESGYCYGIALPARPGL